MAGPPTNYTKLTTNPTSYTAQTTTPTSFTKMSTNPTLWTLEDDEPSSGSLLLQTGDSLLVQLGFDFGLQ